MAGLTGEAPELSSGEAPRRRHDPVQHEHVDVRSGRAGGLRLAVRPHAEHRIMGAGVELGEDRDAHTGTRV